MSIRTYSRAYGAALAGLALIGLAACGDDDAERDEEGQITESGDVDVFSLQVGDCINDDTLSGDVASAAAVPCGEAHDNEVYFSHMIEGDDFPGQEAVTTEADTACEQAFEEFVGVAYADSDLYFTHLTPTSGSWENGDREVLCLIYEPNQQVTGSLEGAAR